MIGAVIATLTALIITAAFLWLVGNVIYEFIMDVFSSTAREIKFSMATRKSEPLSEERKGLLTKYFPYYEALNADEKKRFEKRVSGFMLGKMFFDEKMQPLDDRLALMVSASAVQLTFGLALFRLGHFNRIQIFPGRYYVGENHDKVYYGHVLPSGSIYLSWEAFSFGYKDEHDGLNTGIHELAHALDVENRLTGRDLHFLERFGMWEKLAATEMMKMREGKKSILRSYGTKNLHEMFAVCCECFFELADQMEKELPELFQMMQKVLRQDPRIANNPVLHEKAYDKPNVLINPKREIERIKRPFYEDIPAIAILVVIFAACFYLYWPHSITEIPSLVAGAIFITILIALGIYYFNAMRNASNPEIVKSEIPALWRKAVYKTLMLFMIVSMITAFLPIRFLCDLGLVPEGSGTITPISAVVFLISVFLMGILKVFED